MAKKQQSIDGFIPRRPRSDMSRQFDAFDSRRPAIRPIEQAPELPEPSQKVYQNDITASLNTIDQQEAADAVEQPKQRRHFRLFGRHHRGAKPHRKLRKRITLTIIAIIVIIAGFFAVQALIASGKLLHGDFLSLLQPGTPLKTDSQGRTNILVFGTSQDDAAHQNADGGGGLWLTDSIMLISMNQKDHTIKTVSIPRDLWVKMPSGCMIGYQQKINAVYECGGNLAADDASAQHANDYAQKDAAGAHALESTIKDVTGITPQYYAHVNYTVLKQAIDAVGGVDVNIVGDGANGIRDTNFDWDCPNGPYTCKNVYYPHDGTYHIDGTQALFLARARADSGLYSYKDFGLDQGDFDRQMNQQKILDALKQKATSTGTLMNPVALTKLLSALGNNITTNLDAGNYKTLVAFTKKMPAKAMKSVSLVETGKAVVQSQQVDGTSAVVATSGLLDYSSMISYIAQKLSTNPAVAEGATVAIYNASGTSGAASDLETKLSGQGIDVADTGNAAAADAGSGQYTLYDLSKGAKPNTIGYLESKLGATLSKGPLPSDITSSADIVIVIGPSIHTSNNSN